MKILIAGASGLIGRALTNTLMQNHDVIVLGRDSHRLTQLFPEKVTKISWRDLSGQPARDLDLVINLCGSNIGAKRWSESVKNELIESRTSTNHSLTNWLIEQKAKPRYYCASAVGIYGAHDDATMTFDEDSPIASDTNADFLCRIGREWEYSLQPAIHYGMPVTTLRFGVVLKKGEGMLKKLELPYLLGMGATLGSGQQIISWIHHEDLVNALLFLLAKPEITGPVNITAPNPVSQMKFAKQLARALKRPCFLNFPAAMIKLLFGEMGEYLLLQGQEVMPQRLMNLHFAFTYPELAQALEREYSN